MAGTELLVDAIYQKLMPVLKDFLKTEMSIFDESRDQKSVQLIMKHDESREQKIMKHVNKMCFEMRVPA